MLNFCKVKGFKASTEEVKVIYTISTIRIIGKSFLLNSSIDDKLCLFPPNCVNLRQNINTLYFKDLI